MATRRFARNIIAAGILAALFNSSGAARASDREIAPMALLVAENGTDVFRFPARPGDTFTLSWVHSVEDEAWEETFQLAPAGKIEIQSTRFKTFGAGVPSSGAETTRFENGWVVMGGIDRTVDPLAVLATPQQRYRLRWKTKSYDLTPDGKPHLLTFAIAPLTGENALRR